MAQNLELRVKSDGTFDGEGNLIYIKTHVDQVDGLLDSNNKFSLSLIPSALLETKKLVGVMSIGLESLANLLGDIASYHNDATVLYPGSYFISQGTTEITKSSGHTIQFDDDGLPSSPDTITLENGDSLFYIGGLGSTYTWDEKTVNYIDDVPGSRVFATYEELAAYKPSESGTKAIVTGYRWKETTSSVYYDAVKTYEGFGSLVPTYKTINGVVVPTNSIWREDGDVVVRYAAGANGTTYWLLEEVISGGYQTSTTYDGICMIDGVGDPTYTTKSTCEAQTGGIWEASVGVGMFEATVETGQHVWGVVNNSYGLVSETAQGLMSSASFNKLNGIEAGANKYTHYHSETGIFRDMNANQTIDVISVNEEGHVTGISTQTIREASTSQDGLVELATVDEMKTATDTSRASTPSGVKAAIDYFGGLKIYNSIATDLTTANAAHPNGAIALFTS